MAARWEFGIPFFSRIRGTRNYRRGVRHPYLELSIMAVMLVVMILASMNGLVLQGDMREHIDDARSLGSDLLPSIFDEVPARGEVSDQTRQFLREVQDTDSAAILTDLLFAGALLIFLFFAARGFERTMANLDIQGAPVPRWWKWRMLLPWFFPLLGLRTTSRIVGWSIARAWSQGSMTTRGTNNDEDPVTWLVIPSGDLEGRVSRITATEWSYYTMLVAPLLTLTILLAVVVKVRVMQRALATSSRS